MRISDWLTRLSRSRMLMLVFFWFVGAPVLIVSLMRKAATLLAQEGDDRFAFSGAGEVAYLIAWLLPPVAALIAWMRARSRLRARELASGRIPTPAELKAATHARMHRVIWRTGCGTAMLVVRWLRSRQSVAAELELLMPLKRSLTRVERIRNGSVAGLCILLGGASLLGGHVASRGALEGLSRAQSTADWPHASGEIIVSRVEHGTRADGTRGARAVIRYGYALSDGTKYIGFLTWMPLQGRVSEPTRPTYGSLQGAIMQTQTYPLGKSRPGRVRSAEPGGRRPQHRHFAGRQCGTGDRVRPAVRVWAWLDRNGADAALWESLPRRADGCAGNTGCWMMKCPGTRTSIMRVNPVCVAASRTPLPARGLGDGVR